MSQQPLFLFSFAPSLDYDFIATRDDILRRAFRMVGAISPDESLTTNQTVQGSMALNATVKEWQTRHIFLWNLISVSVTISASTNNKALSLLTPVIALESAKLKLGTNQYEPLEVIQMRDFKGILSPADVGDPTVCVLDAAQALQTLYVWPTPTVERIVELVCYGRNKDWDAGSATGDLPSRFQQALTFSVAAQLGDEYGIPLQERDRYRAEAENLLLSARNSDRPRETYDFVRGAY
jgi:hypothetical protein